MITILCIIIILFVIALFLRRSDNKKNISKKTDKKLSYDVKVIKELSTDKNFLISPYSIKVALGMLRDGSTGNSNKQISDLIGNDDISLIESSEKVSNANGLFIKDQYKSLVEENYINTLSNNYSSEVIFDKFEKPDVLNNWVNEKTFGMIDKAVEEVPSDFVLGLVNAIAIDVSWNIPFECDKTSSEEFIRNDNSKINVEMMKKTYSSSQYKYFIYDDFKGVVLPYKKEEDLSLEFVAILPNNDVNSFINNLTDSDLERTYKNITVVGEKELYVELPRFSYSYEVEDLIESLKSLGVKDVFDSSNASLYNIITSENLSKNNLGNIYVDTAVHKAVIEINEKGTKAAAITYFGMKNVTAIEEDKKIVSIEFNKPFVYIIRDSKTHEILFMGAVYEPNKWNGSTCSDS